MNKKGLFLTLLLAMSALSIKAMQKEEFTEEETEQEPVNYLEKFSPIVQQWANEVKNATNDSSQAYKIIEKRLNLPENQNIQKSDYAFLRQLVAALSKIYTQSPFYFLTLIKNPTFVDRIAREIYKSKRKEFPISLMQAAEKGDGYGVYFYLIVKHENPNQSDEHGRTPLHFAVNYPVIVNRLLKQC
jgi:hypothetical protein